MSQKLATLQLDANQARCLLDLIALRLRVLSEMKPLTPREQVEYQTLRNIALKIRDAAHDVLAEADSEE